MTNPAVVEWINNNRGNSFADSLSRSLEKWGSLSPAQEAAVVRSLNKPQPVTVDLTRINELFSTAIDAGLKRPNIRLGAIKISLAPATGVNAGSLYVKNNDGEYLGKITPAGKFFKSREASETDEQTLIAAAKDPRGAAVAYGKETGSCSCCGRLLTDPNSIAAGIGPICADNWGL